MSYASPPLVCVGAYAHMCVWRGGECGAYLMDYVFLSLLRLRDPASTVFISESASSSPPGLLVCTAASLSKQHFFFFPPLDRLLQTSHPRGWEEAACGAFVEGLVQQRFPMAVPFGPCCSGPAVPQAPSLLSSVPFRSPVLSLPRKETILQPSLI